MPPQLFVFVQMEFPWVLGPVDGRYLLRSPADREPERVLVLQTIKHEHAPANRITLVDPVSLPAEHQARAWLEELERAGEQGLEEPFALLNRVLYLHRIAAADPYVHEVSATQALAIRAGWGSGEQMAAGRWTHASELHAGSGRRQRRGLLGLGTRRARASALASQERIAMLLGARVPTLLCEELALRARLDLDQGRVALAALGLEDALAVAVRELRAERREDLALRIDELVQLRGGVVAQSEGALAGSPAQLDEEIVGHALARLEAALRARNAVGVKSRGAG